MRSLLKFIYNKFPTHFQEFMVEEFIGQIPEKVQDEAIDFLIQGRVKLEKWIFFNAYHLQRRAVGDLENAQLYQGMMIFLKVILSVTSRKIPRQERITVDIPKEIGPTALEQVDSFVTDMNELRKKGETPLEEK